jgi:hypothetical protein
LKIASGFSSLVQLANDVDITGQLKLCFDLFRFFKEHDAGSQAGDISN